MNRRRKSKVPYWIAGVCALALVAWVVLMVVIFRDDDSKNNKNNTDNKTKHENDITETPGATPTIAVPEGSILVWRVTECMNQRDGDEYGTRTEYEYNELGQCMSATRYDRTGAVWEIWRFAYSMTKSRATGEDVPQTVVTMVQNPDSGEETPKYAMINTYEGDRPVTEMTGETTDAKNLEDFRATSRVDYEYDENGECKDIRTYIALTSGKLRLTKREFAVVRDTTPEISEWWVERYMDDVVYERQITFSDSCGAFLTHSSSKFNDEGCFEFGLTKQVINENTVLYSLVELGNAYIGGDRVAETVEVNERANGSRMYTYMHYYFDNTSELERVEECDENGRRILAEGYDRSFVSQHRWEYDDAGRLTKWYIYSVTLESYECGCELEFDSEGHVVSKKKVDGNGVWKTVYDAVYDYEGKLTQRTTTEGTETFSYEFDEFGNCTEFRYKTPDGNFREDMKYTPVVITGEQAKEAGKYFFPSCDALPKVMQEREEPEMELY